MQFSRVPYFFTSDNMALETGLIRVIYILGIWMLISGFSALLTLSHEIKWMFTEVTMTLESGRIHPGCRNSRFCSYIVLDFFGFCLTTPPAPRHPRIFDETPGREEVMSWEISFSKDPRWAESSANAQDGSIPQHTPPVWAASWICLTGSRKKMPHLAKLGSWNQESPGCHLLLPSSLR